MSKRIRVTETMELDTPEAIVTMVHANLGVSIMPDLAVKPLHQVPVKRVSLGLNAPTRVLGLAYAENQIKMRAIDEIFSAFDWVIQNASDRSS